MTVTQQDTAAVPYFQLQPATARALVQALADERTRYRLDCLCVDAQHIVSTNGKMLVWQKHGRKLTDAPARIYELPSGVRPAIRNAKRWIGAAVTPDALQLEFSHKKRVALPRAEGVYPPWRQAWHAAVGSEMPTTGLKLDPTAVGLLLDALNVIGSACTYVTLFPDGRAVLGLNAFGRFAGPATRESEIAALVEMLGEPFTIGEPLPAHAGEALSPVRLDAAFLATALAVYGDSVRWHNGSSPALFGELESYGALVMPQELDEGDEDEDAPAVSDDGAQS